jgi:hypothetical protein
LKKFWRAANFAQAAQCGPVSSALHRQPAIGLELTGVHESELPLLCAGLAAALRPR